MADVQGGDGRDSLVAGQPVRCLPSPPRADDVQVGANELL